MKSHKLVCDELSQDVCETGSMAINSDQFFGHSIRLHREGMGWSKNEFAQKLRDAGLSNFHPTTVTRLEDGSRATRLHEAAIIAKVLEHSIDSLVNFTYPYEDLEEAIDFYDHACRRVVWHEKVAAVAYADAIDEERDLSAKLLSDESISEDERELSKKAIERFKEVVVLERVEYWSKNMGDVEEDEEFYDFRWEAIRNEREARVRATTNGDD